jgi:hypothetical protein
MDDVVGGFGHRAIAIGLVGVEAGVVQRRKADETPFTKGSDEVSLLLQRPSSSRSLCAGDVRNGDAAGARGQS